jgi:SAM-dependent methyltransferase
MTRLQKYFAAGGRYLLDAGSGPIQHDEVLGYGANFETRVCVDLSPKALLAARSRLGDRGVYLEGDLTSLPINSNSMDAVTCNHVIYQITPEHQRQAFLELHRVLKPGGLAVAVYLWSDAPLMRWLERIVRRLPSTRRLDASQAQPARPISALPHHPHSPAWFDKQDWPFRYKFDTFRVVTNGFMQQYVGDDRGGRLLLDALFALQTLAPTFCGRYGVVPAIVIYKD